ncbi:MAG: hypothetical protein HYY03_08910 [Chloroflexi bacterium]|nr:hypothetical protein [Chloroflexota bacterium]
MRRYWIVVALSAILIVGGGLFFVTESARDGFLPNAPEELLGVALSALVTVFVVERAITSAEERRRLPLSQTILWRIRLHSMHCITLLVAQCDRDIAPANERRDHQGRREHVRHAIQQPDCFSHLQTEERQSLYGQIRASADVVRDELSHHQVVFSWYADLYRAIVEVDYRTLEWSAYRDAELQPDVTGQEENPIICDVARAFLALDDQLQRIPTGE